MSIDSTTFGEALCRLSPAEALSLLIEYANGPYDIVPPSSTRVCDARGLAELITHVLTGEEASADVDLATELSQSLSSALERGGVDAVFEIDGVLRPREIDPIRIAELFGLKDDDLALPGAFALHADHALRAPEGWTWVPENKSLFTCGFERYALIDELGDEWASLDLLSGRGSVAIASPSTTEAVDMSGKETLESALETLELAALDALPVLPHDRGEGDAMDELLAYACNRASQTLWDECREGLGSARSSLDADQAGLLASQYAFYYTDGTLVTPAIVEAYEAAGGAVRLSELVRRVAVGHALADCEWCEEHFQRRGEEEVHEAMAILEREAYGNPDLHDREPEQAPVVPAPVAYEPER